MGAAEWEGVAHAFLEEIGAESLALPPQAIAGAYELELVPTIAGAPGPCVVDGRIRYRAHERPVRVAGTIGHELGHVALERHGEPQSERGAAYVGAAILVPRRSLDAALRRVGWDVERLRETFPHASCELLARRIAEVREAVVTIVDGRRIKARVGTPWLTPPPGPGMTREEQRIVRAAREARARVDEGWISAVPIYDGPFERIIVIAEREQLSMRL